MQAQIWAIQSDERPNCSEDFTTRGQKEVNKEKKICGILEIFDGSDEKNIDGLYHPRDDNALSNKQWCILGV